MKVINIADSKKRNTRVNLANTRRNQYTFQVDAKLRPVTPVRVIRSTLDTDLLSLTRDCSLDALSQKLVDGDPELDLENFGKRVGSTSRLFLTMTNQPAVGVNTYERVYNADDELQEERLAKIVEANINSELPLLWSGRLMPKTEVYKRFVFSNSMQVQHVDGLTFDFLFSMAKELQAQNAMLFVGAGKKANEPLTLSRNGKQYRAFLEGRIDGERYLLVLHLTQLELKPMPESKP